MKITRTTKMTSLPKPYIRIEVFALKYNRQTRKTDRLCKIQGIQIKGIGKEKVSKIIDYIQKCLMEKMNGWTLEI